MKEVSENKRRHVGVLLDIYDRPDGSTHKGLLDHQLVEGMIELLAMTEIVPTVAGWREPVKAPGGRPAEYGDERDRLILVIMLCLLRTGGSPQLVEVADVICNRLTARSRRLLGLPVDNGRASNRAIYFRVRRAWLRFTAVCDPFPGATHLRKTRAEVNKIKKKLRHRGRDAEAVKTSLDPEHASGSDLDAPR